MNQRTRKLAERLYLEALKDRRFEDTIDPESIHDYRVVGRRVSYTESFDSDDSVEEVQEEMAKRAICAALSFEAAWGHAFGWSAPDELIRVAAREFWPAEFDEATGDSLWPDSPLERFAAEMAQNHQSVTSPQVLADLPPVFAVQIERAARVLSNGQFAEILAWAVAQGELEGAASRLRGWEGRVAVARAKKLEPHHRDVEMLAAAKEEVERANRHLTECAEAIDAAMPSIKALQISGPMAPRERRQRPDSSDIYKVKK